MPRAQSPLCQFKPVCLWRALICVFIVLCLNALVNIFNRLVAQYWLGGDLSRRPVNCATLLFLVLLFLVSCQPRCYISLSVGLIQGELLLQCASFLWITQLCSTQLDDLLPFLCDTFIGSFRVFKLLLLGSLVAALIYVIVYYVDYDLSCCGADDSDDSDDPCDDPPPYDRRRPPAEPDDMSADFERSFVSRSCQTRAPPPPPAWRAAPQGRGPYTQPGRSKNTPYAGEPSWWCSDK